MDSSPDKLGYPLLDTDPCTVLAVADSHNTIVAIGLIILSYNTPSLAQDKVGSHIDSRNVSVFENISFLDNPLSQPWISRGED